MERAVFVSRAGALMAIVKKGRENALCNETIIKRGKTFPRYVKGEMVGWEAWLPPYEGATFNSPIREGMV
jgi:hypothetical protein